MLSSCSFLRAMKERPTLTKLQGLLVLLYYCTVNIAGEPVKAMVDTESSATILLWDVFYIGWMASMGVEVEDFMIHSDTEG